MKEWYMHNPESVLEKEMHKLLWYFEIQTDHLILAIQPDSDGQRKKRTCLIVDLAIPADHWVKIKESEKRDKYLDLARELKKYGTWKWQWYLLCLMHLEQSPKDW